MSDCRRYRYTLWRCWDASLPVVAWVLLNPSTADGKSDDPTIRRLIGFSRGWGYGGLRVVNLFAWRATDPDELERAWDPVGEGNDAAIAGAVIGAGLVVLGWGAHGGRAVRGRADAVLELLGGCSPACLGWTAAGHPRHPLYLTKSAKCRPFAARREVAI